MNLIVSKMRAPDKHGNEYTIYKDDFVPQKQEGGKQAQTQDPGWSGQPIKQEPKTLDQHTAEELEDLPF